MKNFSRTIGCQRDLHQLPVKELKRSLSDDPKNTNSNEYIEPNNLTKVGNGEDVTERHNELYESVEDIKKSMKDILKKIGVPDVNSLRGETKRLKCELNLKNYLPDILSKVDAAKYKSKKEYYIHEIAGKYFPVHGPFTEPGLPVEHAEKIETVPMEIFGDLLRLRNFAVPVTDLYPLNAQNMQEELQRFASFSNFPRYVDISLTRMAQSGFFYTGQGHETKCFSCGLNYDKWKSGDDPRTVHKKLSPNCTLVTNRDTVSEPSSENVVLNSDVNEVSINGANAVASGCGYLRKNPEESFKNEQKSNKCTDIISTNTDRKPISTASYGTTGNDLSTERNYHQDSCSNSTLSQNDDFPSLGINTEKPKYPNYAPLQVRISSFQGWPAYLDQTARQMALAGFLYAGYNDFTRCFYCGGGLRNWEAGDDPWVEHARWFPKCVFIKQNKGEKFIDTVLKRQQDMESETNTNEGYSQHEHKQTSQMSAEKHSDDCDQRFCHSVAARSVLEMGYTKEQIEAAVKEIKEFRSGDKSISATDIMNVLLDDNKHQKEAAIGTATNSNTYASTSNDNKSVDNEYTCTESLLEENQQLRDQRLCKVCLDLDATVAFLPCGHIVCCTDCAPAMRKCPICRTHIKGTVKTYLA